MQKWNIFLRMLQLMVFLVPIAVSLSIGIFVLFRIIFLQH